MASVDTRGQSSGQRSAAAGVGSQKGVVHRYNVFTLFSCSGRAQSWRRLKPILLNERIANQRAIPRLEIECAQAVA